MEKIIRHWKRCSILLAGVANFWAGTASPAFGQGSPEILWTRADHSERINGVDFSSDGTLLASGSSDRLIKIWNAVDGTLIRTINQEAPAVHESAVESVAFSPDNAHIAWPTFQQVYIARVSDGTIRSFRLPNRSVAHEDWAITVAFSPDGTKLASTSFDGTVHIWNVSTLGLIRALQPQSGQMRAAAFSPDGRYLATAGGGPYNVQLWNTTDWSLARNLGSDTARHSNDIWWVAFSPDGTKLVSASEDMTAKIWNVSDGTLLHNLDRHTGRVYSAEFSPDGGTVATVGTGDNTIRLWRVSDGAQIRIYDQNTAEVNTIAISRNNIMAYGRTDDTLVVARLSGSGTITPSVTVTSPAQGDRFLAPAAVSISASVSAPVAKVEFYRDTTKIGEDTTSPYGMTWNNVTAGNYWIRAVAMTSVGNTVASSSVNIVVTNATGSIQPPTVQLVSPLNNSSVRAPAILNLTANASAEGGIARVEFFAGTTKVGEDTSPTYSVAWNAVPAGQYQLRAVAYADNGLSSTSSVVNVVVTNAPAGAPTVVITGPANGASFNAGATVPIVAQATSPGGVQRVEFFAGDTLLGEDATTPYGFNWSSGNTSGSLTLSAVVFDKAGNSNRSAGVTISFATPTNGNGAASIRSTAGGTVFPNLNGTVLVPGRTYAVTARPLSGWLFNGWTGTLASSQPRITFTGNNAVDLQANFIPNPFIPRRGSYAGLVQGSTPTHATRGFLNLTLASSGTFSARLLVGGKSQSFSGKFSNQGQYSRTLTGPGLSWPLTLQLDSNGTSQSITGTVQNAGETLSVEADRAAFHPLTNPAPGGRFTLLISTPEELQNVPQGPGIGGLSVDGYGRIRVSGALADGTPFSQGTFLSQERQWPLYAPLYASQGSLSGEIEIRETTSSDLDGEVLWSKPVRPGDRFYPGGFSTTIPLLGSRYQPPAVGTPLIQATPSSIIPLVLGGGNLEEPLQNGVNVSGLNRVTVVTNEAARLAVGLSTASGQFRGQFYHPARAGLVPFRGIIFQKQNFGAGFFLGQNQSGYVLLNRVK